MLWRAQRIQPCSPSSNKALQLYRPIVTPAPFQLRICSRTLRSTSRQLPRISHRPLRPRTSHRPLENFWPAGGSSGNTLRQKPPISHRPLKTPQPAEASPGDDASTRPELVSHAWLLAKEVQNQELFKDEIRVAGLIQSLRKQKHAAFARLSDGTTLKAMQAVLLPEQTTGITNGTYVSLVGTWQKSPGKDQSFELQVRSVEELGPSDPEQYPIQKKHQTQDYLRTLPHLRLRVPFHSLVARARAMLTRMIMKQYERKGAVLVHPPLITSSDCEGAGEVFTIIPRSAPSTTDAEQKSQQYFREQKYLTVSSQLHLEAYSAELGDVYTLSPAFRAEESDTPRHLSEFYMLEVEHRAVQNLEQLMRYMEASFQFISKMFMDTHVARELEQYYEDQPDSAEEKIDIAQRWSRLSRPADGRYTRILHQDAVRQLLEADNANGGTLFNTKPSYTNGLQLEHERWIVKNVGKDQPVFVTHYPKSAKPFYMLPSQAQQPSDIEYSNQGIETVACFDLLLPFGYCEVAGGSLREHRLENLLDSMRERGMLKKRDNATLMHKQVKDARYPFLRPDEDLGSLRWYADLRRFGTSPHGGFGLGFDRLLAYLVGVNNVRDVVAFPRAFGRADC
jgi:asparaginyl-tRNA synthetase